MGFEASYMINMKPEEIRRLSSIFPGKVYSVTGYMRLDNGTFRGSSVVKMTVESYTKQLVERDVSLWISWISEKLGRDVAVLGRTP